MNIQYMSLGVALITFFGGLLSFFSPCVCPLIPGYLAYLARFTSPQTAPLMETAESATAMAGSRVPSGVGTAAAIRGHGSVSAVVDATDAYEATPLAKARARFARVASVCSPAFTATALFVLGFSAAFVALGLLAASFGSLVAAYQPVMQTVVGIVMLFMGALVLGWLPLELLEPFQREFRLHLPTQKLRPLGPAAPFALGIVFAAGWTPCIGPVLGALLTYVGASANLGWGATLMSVYALGFAVPFLTLGAGWSVSLRATRWVTRHGHAVSRITGIALLLIGVLYVTGEITVFAIWAQRYTPSVFPR